MIQVTRCEAFLKWAQETFGADSWYTLTPAMVKHIRSHWQQWEEALIAWGIITSEETGEEAFRTFFSLSPQDITHIGEAIQEEEKERVKVTNVPLSCLDTQRPECYNVGDS